MDTQVTQRLSMFGLGLLGGASLLFIPNTPEYRSVETTRVVTKTVEVVQTKVEYKDRWRDRVVTVEKANGDKTTIVEHSGETTGTKTDTKETEKEVTKEASKEITKSGPKYSVGVEYANIGFTGTLAARLGNTPFWLTTSFGAFQAPLNFSPFIAVGLRLEF